MTTIAKVAKRAKVSPTTVSHVLNHADRVSAHLRKKVLQAIEELGYVPNPQAKSLRTGRTNLVAMLVPDIRNPFYPELVRGVQVEFASSGIDVLIFNTDLPGGKSGQHVREYFAQIKARRVDALIVAGFALHGITDPFQELEIPVVFIGDPAKNQVDSVKVDDFGGGYLVGQYLARMGHKRIAHITGPNDFGEAMARAKGFEQGLADSGVELEPTLRFEGTYLAPSGRKGIRHLFAVADSAHIPTAVFFGNFQMALAGLAELYDCGLNVPQQVEVALFGDLPQAEHIRPRLVRVGRPPSDLARAAVAMLLQRLDRSYVGEPRSELLTCALRLREQSSNI